MDIFQAMDAVLHALADPHRRLMVEALSVGETAAGGLGALVPIAQPGVSRHLSVLREAGLVDVRRDGQRRIYRLRPQGLVEVDDWLDARRQEWEHRMRALHTEVARGRRDRQGNE
ncbi:ArsR/SmtB family transcription factor [Serinicoccus profundi]|uniref:ArsR/SmtB family transcription factor n=2 Tax=Serinicoccus profundi TaxID=1078471 RepID=UPI001EE962F4|nr:metalloregulator ArsR/SmtB family transcription factor [Serinicoccus profundi]